MLNEILKLEELGYVADSQELRLKLIQSLDNSEKDLQTIQAELKIIKQSAKKQGLFLREDLVKKNYTLEESIQLGQENQNKAVFKKLKDLPSKSNIKRSKI